VYLHGHFFKYVLRRMGKLEERAGSEVHTLYPRIRSGIGIKELYARPTRYGMEKGVVYARELGAEHDQVRRHSTVVFPFYTQTGAGGAPRSEYQIRVPMDDTHTYHICYQVYAAPSGVEAPRQDSVPHYEVPLTDGDGTPILDYVLAQDMLAWRAQGTITDRTREHLGRTDLPIVFLRRQLDEQIRIVENGGAPMNVFQDPAAMGTVLHGSGDEPDAGYSSAGLQPLDARGPSAAMFRAQYHKGFVLDDADRYGPAVPLIQELHHRIEERMAAQAGAGAAAVDARV
jgi:5,5'-dehydrodivanillate O-demethylase